MTAPIWHKTADILPPCGVVVMTKIDDDQGVRNEQELELYGNLWFVKGGSMYVYYRPTHWREVTA